MKFEDPRWKHWRDANTLSNLAYPLAGVLAVLVVGWSLDSLAMIVGMVGLGVYSATWHWLGHPWNVADRYAMFVALTCAGWAGSWVAIAVLLAVTVASFWVGSTPLVGALVLSGLGRLFYLWWGELWYAPLFVLALYVVAVLTANLDRRFGEPHRRGPVHASWHLVTAAAIGLHFVLTVMKAQV